MMHRLWLERFVLIGESAYKAGATEQRCCANDRPAYDFATHKNGIERTNAQRLWFQPNRPILPTHFYKFICP